MAYIIEIPHGPARVGFQDMWNLRYRRYIDRHRISTIQWPLLDWIVPFCCLCRFCSMFEYCGIDLGRFFYCHFHLFRVKHADIIIGILQRAYDFNALIASHANIEHSDKNNIGTSVTGSVHTL